MSGRVALYKLSPVLVQELPLQNEENDFTYPDGPLLACEEPTNMPTNLPTTDDPTHMPTELPTTDTPTHMPTALPTTDTPTQMPSEFPTTDDPTSLPSTSPSHNPSEMPSNSKITVTELDILPTRHIFCFKKIKFSFQSMISALPKIFSFSRKGV